MPFEPRAGTLAEWETYVSALKELNAGLLRAGVQDGVWSPRARPFRETGGRLLIHVPYTERLKIVRASWAKALNETERAEVGQQALGLGFTKEQLNYAGKAAIDTFLKYDPKLYIDTFRSPVLETLKRYMTTPPHYGRDRYGAQPFWYHGSDFSRYKSGDTVVTGLTAHGMIIDDIINTKGKKVKTAKPKPKTYNTVGVRFLRGHNLAKVYTYKVAKKTKLQLGEEIVVPSTFDGLTTNGIGVVVELHKEPQDTTYGIDYKFVTGRIAKIAQ